MALVVKDRVQETSTTTGTGTITLAGAVSGFQSFSVIGNANTTYYAIVGGAEWEVGLGTYTSSGTTLSRDTILESSNGGTAVNFSAGTKNVFVTYPAEKGLYLDASGNAIALGTPASATLTNATGLPISTGVSGLGTNVATFLATPTSANLAAALTDETGTGANVFATSPTVASPTFTSQATFAAGTAAAPTITTTGDTNTGIFFPAADTIAFAEGGAEAMRIDSSSNVGIGTTSPSTYVGASGGLVVAQDVTLVNNTTQPANNYPRFLQISGIGPSISGFQFTVNTGGSATTAPTERMLIDSSGNVKLSTASTSIQNSSGRPILNQSGSILQVKSTTLSSTFTSATGNAWTNITGLSVSITTSSTSSTILVRYVVAGVLFRPTANGVGVRVLRGATAIGVGNASGSILQIGSSSAIASLDSQQTAAWEFLDTPASTSAQTYQVQFYQDTPASPFYINRSVNDPIAGGRSISTITVMEVSA